MAVIERMMDAAEADIDVLNSLNSQGDNFDLHRDVDFLLEAPTKEKAELICGFINDYNYGHASLEGEHNGVHRVTVVINMPINQNIITSVSGLMVCISSLFDGVLNGWGCCAQTQA